MPCNTHDISEFETPVMEKFVPGCKKVSVGNFNSILSFLKPIDAGAPLEWVHLIL